MIRPLTLPPPEYRGRAGWWDLPPVIEDAPCGVQIVERVRRRELHRAEYPTGLGWLDAACGGAR